jgi:uncharacterized protein (TIGR02596 family)
MKNTNAAFSLVELLVVLALVAILAVLTLPAVGGIHRANSVNHGGQLLSDSLVAARQEASTKNRDVELRMIQAGTPPEFRAFQTWLSDDRGVMRPSGKIVALPEGSLISADTQLSPLLSANVDLAGVTNFASLGSRPYVALRIRAGGLPDPGVTQSNNFLTVRALTDVSVPPVNFYTVRIDPSTGRVTIHRP